MPISWSHSEMDACCCPKTLSRSASTAGLWPGNCSSRGQPQHAARGRSRPWMPVA